MPADGETTTGEHPSVLMLGKGWFPHQLGGLDRYFRDLLERQPETSGVVIGPASGSPERLVAVSRHDAPLPWRLLAFSRATRHAARDAAVVDAHFALYALVPLLSRRLRSLPVVVHFQGPWADEHVAQGDGSALRRSLRRAIERTVYRRGERVIVLSSAFRRLVVERYRVSPWRVRVEPPGVDLERFSPGDRRQARERLGLGTCPFVAVSVRRLVSRMGLDTLIAAWAQALSALPRGAQLLIAGDGPQRHELEELVASGGLQESVRFLGRVDEDALVDLYRAADVGIVPTRSFEGFGLVVIEAAACGTPTIVTRIGGLPEAVAGLDRSLAVQAGDVPALAARIAQAACAGGLPSRPATRRFAEGYSWLGVVERHRAVLREAVAPESAERRMRVVYLDHVAQLSGGEIALLRLVTHLDEVEPHVILAEDGPFAEELVQAGISTEVLPMPERARGLRKDSVTAPRVQLRVVLVTAGYILRLALYLRRLRPDIVHTNSLKAGVYGSIAGRMAGVPVVWHVRDRIETDYLPRAAVRMVRGMTRRLAATVVVNSHSTLATLDPRAQPEVVYSVVSVALAVPAHLELRERGPLVVGMVGRFAPWKGQDLFLRAFADAFPDGDTRCVLVGAALFGEHGFDQELHKLARSLGVDDRVEFRGFRTDIWPELARMDMLVHASLIPEPFGQVILEGMAARVPVVAADAGGPAEIVHHDVNGILYRMGDRAALARSLRELAENPERRRRLVDGGLSTVAAYDPGVVSVRLQRLYRTVIRNEHDR
ncbi:MAG: glycosyltransferase [Solirubrobacteraceae bacterium]